MGIRSIESLGPVSLSGTDVFTDVLAPQAVPASLNSHGVSEVTIKRGLVIAEVDVGNESGNTAACGWGYRYPAADLQIYDWNGSNVATAVLKGVGSTFSLGAILIKAPGTFHGLEVTFGASSNANVVTKYFNGSSFVAFPVLEDNRPLLAATNTSSTMVKPKQPLAWAADSLGKFDISVEVDAPVTISAISAVRLLDYVDVVASGNALSKEFIGEACIPASLSLVAYVSEANANNWAQVDYSQR